MHLFTNWKQAEQVSHPALAVWLLIIREELSKTKCALSYVQPLRIFGSLQLSLRAIMYTCLTGCTIDRKPVLEMHNQFVPPNVKTRKHKILHVLACYWLPSFFYVDSALV